MNWVSVCVICYESVKIVHGGTIRYVCTNVTTSTTSGDGDGLRSEWKILWGRNSDKGCANVCYEWNPVWHSAFPSLAPQSFIAYISPFAGTQTIRRSITHLSTHFCVSCSFLCARPPSCPLTRYKFSHWTQQFTTFFVNFDRRKSVIVINCVRSAKTTQTSACECVEDVLKMGARRNN